jgi:hypothetical protein
MLDMSSIMPILTTPSEILGFSCDCATHAAANKRMALEAITSDLFIVTSRAVDGFAPALLSIASDRETCQ